MNDIIKDISKDVTKDVIKDVIIKEALPEDAEARIAYARQVGSETDNLSFGKEGFPISIEEEQEEIRNFSKDPKSVCYFAWKNGKLVGSGELRAFPRRMSHRAELGLTVVKAEWNSGIGTKLMQKLIDYAGENAVELINLEVRGDNSRAIHLYEKFGFKKVGTLPAYFKIGEEYIDFDSMVLDLR